MFKRSRQSQSDWRSAAFALGRTGDSRAVPLLVDCLRHPDQDFQETAVYVLEKHFRWRPANGTEQAILDAYLARERAASKSVASAGGAAANVGALAVGMTREQVLSL